MKPRLRLQSHVIASSSGEYSRNVWYQPGPDGESHPLCVFLDGEHYLRDMDALPLINALIASGDVPAMSLLFVSHVSSDPTNADYNCRHVDYTCNVRYSKFIADDVVKWAKRRNANIQNKDNMICGVSLSGLASAYITFQYPEIFSSALSQSGSFWWLAGKNVVWPPTKAKFWLSVGDQETASNVIHARGLRQEESQIAGVEQAARKFTSLGGTVNYAKYSGGHAPTAWKADLPAALKWLAG